MSHARAKRRLPVGHVRGLGARRAARVVAWSLAVFEPTARCLRVRPVLSCVVAAHQPQEIVAVRQELATLEATVASLNPKLEFMRWARASRRKGAVAKRLEAMEAGALLWNWCRRVRVHHHVTWSGTHACTRSG